MQERDNIKEEKDQDLTLYERSLPWQ